MYIIEFLSKTYSSRCFLVFSGFRTFLYKKKLIYERKWSKNVSKEDNAQYQDSKAQNLKNRLVKLFNQSVQKSFSTDQLSHSTDRL